MNIKMSPWRFASALGNVLVWCAAVQAAPGYDTDPLTGPMRNPFGVPQAGVACAPEVPVAGMRLLAGYSWNSLQLKAVVGSARYRLAWIQPPQGELVRVRTGDRIGAQDVQVTRINPRRLWGTQPGKCGDEIELELSMEQVGKR